MRVVRWILTFASLAVCSPALAVAQALETPTPPPHYDLRLELDPERQHVHVTGTITLPRTDSVRFFLHRQLQVGSFGLSGDGEYSVDRAESGMRYLPDAMTVTVAGRTGAGPMEVAFDYGGSITEWSDLIPSTIGPEWTEIGLYYPWFPYAPGIGPFTYRLEVDAAPRYTVSAMGEPERRGTATVFRRTRPTNDMVVVAAPDLTVRESRAGSSTVRLAATGLSGATADSILADASRIQEHYRRWFGAVSGDMLLVVSEREQGGGYARPGGAFLAGLEDSTYLDDRSDHVRYLGHELAHLWWYRADADSWEDWLNESMAEYSALLAVREVAGRSEYERRLAAKREAAEGAPALIGFDRNGSSARTLLYSKGPVLLAELEDRIGRPGILGLARTFRESEVAATAAFLDTLEQLHGAEVREWFEARLRQE